MGISKNLLVVLSVMLTLSCQQDWKSTLERFDKNQLYGNDHEGWVLFQELENEYDYEYTLQKIDKDTLKVLFLLQSKNGNHYVNGYKKTFNCGSIDTCHLEMQQRDTLFYYKTRQGQKIFIQGEYSYRFTMMKFGKEELDFYTLYEDSLRVVKGNKLPKLPSLNAMERSRLDSLLKK